MAKEICQTLARDIDNLSTRIDELQRELEATYREVVMLRRGDPQTYGVSLRAIIGLGAQMDANDVQSSTDKGVQMVAGGEARDLCSRPYPILVSDEGENGWPGSHNLGILSSTVSEASEGGAPRRQSTLFSIACEAGVEEGEVVHLAVGEVAGSGKGSRRTRWFDQDRMDLLQEIDFLWTAILLERSEATQYLAGVRMKLFEFLHEADHLKAMLEI